VFGSEGLLVESATGAGWRLLALEVGMAGLDAFSSQVNSESCERRCGLGPAQPWRGQIRSEEDHSYYQQSRQQRQ
jgi:hypothetical protein